MTLKVSGTLAGNVKVPVSKSQAHRMLICAACAETPCTIVCGNMNRDIEATIDCLKALGAPITYSDGVIHVTPINQVIKGGTLQCGESGSTLRFLLPVAAALGADAVFDGEGRLAQRPLSPLYEEMVRHGVCLSEHGVLPLYCKGKLQPGAYSIDGGVSSQFISGLLMALPLTGEECMITVTGCMESAPYIELTLSVMRMFGIKIDASPHGFIIPANQRYHAPQQSIETEGDWSAAAFWIVAGVMGRESITCRGLNCNNSSQGDSRIIEVLQRFGADFHINESSVTAIPSKLSGCTVDCADIPDLVPALTVAATKAHGTTIFNNVGRLRIKESDRIEALVSLLRGAGIEAHATADSLTIIGGAPHPTTYNPQNDHRMAMAAAVLAAAWDCPIVISHAECVAKSYPQFFEDFCSLGGNTEHITIQ